MKNFISLFTVIALLTVSCFCAQAQSSTQKPASSGSNKVEVNKQHAEVKGSNGGKAEATKGRTEVKGKNGGGIKIDKNGLEIKNKKGEGLTIEGKKKN